MSSRFEITQLPLEGVRLLERRPLGDNRGLLERMYCVQDWNDLMDGSSIVQINRTLTRECGVVRGMHFQWPPHAEKKAVSCLRGEVLDVVVDLRQWSSTFLQWHAELLSEKNHRTMFIPEGFAHGFQTLTTDCELLYFHTAMYNSAAEDGLNAMDPKLAIEWPKEVTSRSQRDIDHPMLTPEFSGVNL